MSVAAESDDIPLEVPFRGRRNYLHSTTIFDQILRHLADPVDVTFTIRQLIRQPIALATSLAGRIPVGEFSCIDNGCPREFHICLADGAPAPGRAEDNEQIIIGASVAENGRLGAIVGNPGTFIETVVALQKHFVGSCAKPGRKLLFSRLRITRMISAGPVFIDRLEIMGNRLFKSHVSGPGDEIGRITFMAADL